MPNMTAPAPQETRPPLANGYYRARCINILEVPNINTVGFDGQPLKYDTQWEWHFNIIAKGVEEDRVVKKWTSPSLHEKASAFQIAKALLGREPKPLEDFHNGDDFIGKECTLQLERAVSGKGTEYNKIISFGPPMGADLFDSPDTPEIESKKLLATFNEAKSTLSEDHDISPKALKTRAEAVANQTGKFETWPIEAQREVAQHFAAWAADPSSYDAEGTVKF